MCVSCFLTGVGIVGNTKMGFFTICLVQQEETQILCLWITGGGESCG